MSVSLIMGVMSIYEAIGQSFRSFAFGEEVTAWRVLLEIH